MEEGDRDFEKDKRKETKMEYMSDGEDDLNGLTAQLGKHNLQEERLDNMDQMVLNVYYDESGLITRNLYLSRRDFQELNES